MSHDRPVVVCVVRVAVCERRISDVVGDATVTDRGSEVEQAWAAASEVVDKYMTFEDTDDGAEARAQVIALTAVGWIEGRRAGGQEAIAAMRARVER